MNDKIMHFTVGFFVTACARLFGVGKIAAFGASLAIGSGYEVYERQAHVGEADPRDAAATAAGGALAAMLVDRYQWQEHRLMDGARKWEPSALVRAEYDSVRDCVSRIAPKVRWRDSVQWYVAGPHAKPGEGYGVAGRAFVSDTLSPWLTRHEATHAGTSVMHGTPDESRVFTESCGNR